MPMGQDDVQDSSRQHTVDTRNYVELDPVKLPPKLKDRIEKAQRRAAAAKDGVAIFKETEDSKNNKKYHLPDVILGHKMRDFEAKPNQSAIQLDSLDNTLNKLSIEAKEKVLTKIQEKIQTITEEVNQQYTRINEEFNSHGIFDSNANSQRAQAICLVELQKRCKIEKIRDHAIKEVTQLQEGSNNQKNNHYSGKLSSLLNQQNPKDSSDAALLAKRRSVMDTTCSRAKIVAIGSKKHQIARKPSNEQLLLHSLDCCSSTPELSSNRVTQQEIPPQSSSQSKEDHTSETESNSLARHPQVALVIQALRQERESGESFSQMSISRRQLQLVPNNLMNIPQVGFLEEWNERPNSYRIIESRLTSELRHRSSRFRWDSASSINDTKDFVSIDADKIIQFFREQEALKGNGEQEIDEETFEEKRRRTLLEYFSVKDEIQNRIVERKNDGSGNVRSKLETRNAILTPGGSQRVSVSRAQTAFENPNSVHFEIDKDHPQRSMLLESTQRRRLTLTRDSLQKRRKESRIGAPKTMDESMIGRHSGQRMEERRYSALSWDWFHTKPINSSQNGNSFVDITENNDYCTKQHNVSVVDSERSLHNRSNSHENSSKALIGNGISPSKSKKIPLNSTASNAASLQFRIEEIWKKLEFPFSTKLIFLEKYAENEDGEALHNAVIYWEKAVDIVLVREKLKMALVEFGQNNEVTTFSKLLPEQWKYLESEDIPVPPKTNTLSDEDYVSWIRESMDLVTTTCKKIARNLRQKTGDELQFQGQAYPRAQTTYQHDI